MVVIMVCERCIAYYNEFKKKLADQGVSIYPQQRLMECWQQLQQALKQMTLQLLKVWLVPIVLSTKYTSTKVCNQGYNNSSGYNNNYQSVNIDTSNLPDKSKVWK